MALDFGCCRPVAEVEVCSKCGGKGCDRCNKFGYLCRGCGAPVNVETTRSNAPASPRPDPIDGKVLPFRRPQNREIGRKGGS